MKTRSDGLGRSSQRDETHLIRRLQRVAFILGLTALLAAILIGWSAYDVSRKALIAGHYKDTLITTRANVEYLEGSGHSSLDQEALESLRKNFEQQDEQWEGSYLCVMDEHGILVLNTKDRSKEGQDAGHGDFRGTGDDGANPRNLLELVETGQDWIGPYTSLEGERQMSAFACMPKFRALVAVHVPWDSVARRVRMATIPWAIGYGLIVLVAAPLALWGLSKAYSDMVRAEQRARAAERRTAEQVRILREIDRSILAGGSVEEIARNALARIRVLVPCSRASVALIDESKQTSRLLAVESASPTKAGPETVVPLSDLGEGTLDTLRAGGVTWVADTQARTQMKGFFDRLREEGVLSYLKAPLLSQGVLIGTLNLSFDHLGEPAAADVELAREVADMLALAVVQAQLREELEIQTAELEKRVVERTRQLSDVNAELEGYVHSVSHDLRAPLRAVRGFGNLLIEEVGTRLEPTELEYLQRMVSASERMDALLRDLLAYSRLAREDVAVRPLDTQHVVQEAQDLLQVELDERGAVLEIAGPLLPVVGHHSTLVQAVANLLSNASKFVAPGVQPRIRVRTQARAALVRMWIEDNGIGIAPENQDKIFRVFERLNSIRGYPGTGIGLAIVRRAVERMNGRAGVESQVGEGSRFWIDLPRAESAS